jgi:hypothetical protein
VLAPPSCTRFDLRVARPARRGHPSPHHHPAHCLCSPHLSFSISRPLTAEHLPSLFPNPRQHHRDASPQLPLPMAAGRMWRGTSSRPWLRQGFPRARPDASGARVLPLAASSHPDGQNRPAQASPSLCCKCMYQVFQRYVAIVSYGCCKSRSDTCFKCFRDMTQAFIQNISSIPDVCCKRFDLDAAYVSHIYCNNMFQMYHLFLVLRCSKCFRVASVLSRCCIYFTYMLQVYITDVSSLF